MKKSFDNLLKTVLTSEQFAAFKEEFSSGIKKVNSMVEANEKMKAKKDLVLQTSKKIDEMIEKSEKSPVIFKAFYSSMKETVKKMILPFVEEEMEDAGYTDLDDVPDVPEKKAPVEKKVTPSKEKKSRTASNTGKSTPQDKNPLPVKKSQRAQSVNKSNASGSNTGKSVKKK